MTDEADTETMRFEGGETTAVLRTVVRRVREQNLTFLAGSLAYNAFVSLIPLLLLLLIVVGAVGNDVFAARVTALTESYLTFGAQQEIESAVDNAGGKVGISVTGLIILLWGALKLFRGLDTAFAEVYETERDPNLLKQVRDGIVALLAIALSLVALAVAGTAFAYLRLPLLHVLNPLFLLVGLTFAFLPMYYVFPDVAMTVREALPGAVVAAGGWAILEVVFQVYASYAGRYEVYGVIGGILLLLTWLYFGGFVLLVGAMVNAVIREREQGRAGPASGGADDADAPPRTVTGTAVVAPESPATTVAGNSTTPTAGAESTGDDGECGSDPPGVRGRPRTRKDGRPDGRRASERGLRSRTLRNVGVAFAVGVVVGLVSLAAVVVRVGR